MEFKPKLTAVRFGAKVHVHATVTVPTLGYTLTLKPTAGHPMELNLTLTPPPHGTPEGQIVTHLQADEDLFIGINENKMIVNYDGKPLHVTIKPIIT
jgi:hypothetical protein